MIGKRLKEVRKIKGLTQADIAARVGVSLSTVKKWELDLNEPNSDKLIALALTLNVSTDYLFGRDTAPDLVLTKDKERLLAIIDSLPPRQREAVTQYAEFLKEGGGRRGL